MATFLAENTLPVMGDQSDNFIAFMLVSESTGYIAYETHRDFLSSPRCYSIVRVDFNELPLFASGGQLLTDEDWEFVDTQSVGIYNKPCIPFSENSLHEGSVSNNSDLRHWLFLNSSIVFECIAKDVKHVESLYHHPSSFAALMAFF